MQHGMLGNSEVLRRLWAGPLADLVLKLNGENGPELEADLKELLRTRQKPPRPPGFVIRFGLICGSVVCNGYSGESALEYLSGRKFHLSGRIFQMFANFIPPNPRGTVLPFGILGLGDIPEGMRTNERIRNEATRRGYRTPPLEMAPLLRASISDEEIAQMGVSGLTVMCDPVNIPFDGRDDSVWLPWMGKSVEGSEISAHSGSPGNPYGGAEGFVFLLPKWLEYLFRRTVEAKPGSPQDKESEDAFEKLRNDGYM